MKHIKEFAKFNENVSGGGDGRFDVKTDEMIDIFQKLNDDDYEKIIDYFSQDWDSYEMIEELKSKLYSACPKELMDKIDKKYDY